MMKRFLVLFFLFGLGGDFPAVCSDAGGCLAPHFPYFANMADESEEIRHFDEHWGPAYKMVLAFCGLSLEDVISCKRTHIIKPDRDDIYQYEIYYKAMPLYQPVIFYSKIASGHECEFSFSAAELKVGPPALSVDKEGETLLLSKRLRPGFDLSRNNSFAGGGHLERYKGFLREFGRSLGRLHSRNIVHGSLEKEGRLLDFHVFYSEAEGAVDRVFFIDYGDSHFALNPDELSGEKGRVLKALMDYCSYDKAGLREVFEEGYSQGLAENPGVSVTGIEAGVDEISQPQELAAAS